MKKLIAYLPTHFLGAFIVGILLQFHCQVWRYDFVDLILIVVPLLLICLLLHRSAKKRLFSFAVFILFIFIGISSVFIHQTKHHHSYYNRFNNEDTVRFLVVKKVLKSNLYYDKYEAEVYQIDSFQTKGTVLLNIKRDRLSSSLPVGARLVTQQPFSELLPPLNPFQFDYKSYLDKQNIHHQVFLSTQHYKVLGSEMFSWYAFSAKVRHHIQQALKKYDFSEQEYAVINALLLGQRQEISKDLLQQYTNAGAIHILAISGLHVGIILYVLLFVLKPLETFKTGRVLKVVLLIGFLWLFAVIAGLSASVVRAVTMFTFVAIGQSLNKKQYIEHSLVASMFVLLLFKPLFLFDVGFQLSYSAVFGIVYLQPLLYKIWRPSFIGVDFFWKLITVSLSAQMAVLPMSLYYFHQFPSLFLVSNLVIIPVLGGVLFGGIVVIALGLLDVLPHFLANFYGWIISLMNDFVSWVSQQEAFLFQHISMSLIRMLAWYTILIMGYQFAIHQKTRRFFYLLLSILVLQSVCLFETYQRQQKKEFIVFHKNKESMVAQRVGDSLKVYTNVYSYSKETIIQSYKINESIETTIDSVTQTIWQYNDDKIVFVDSLGVYDLPIQNPIVVLQQSPKINLSRLIQKLQPKQVVADGSNYKSYVNRWEETCKKEKTPFHYTGKDGAYIISN